MRATIVDLDWYNKVSFVPNPICMKLSSYFKQNGYNVNFATTNYEISMDCDIMYVVRESTLGKLPSELNICDNKVYLYGKGFRFYKRHLKKLDDIVLACRPDYNLYPLRKDNIGRRQQFVTFYGSDGKLLPARQDFHSAYEKAKDVVVTDVDFWHKKNEEIAFCVELIKEEQNIVFSQPISLKILVNDEEKIKLFMSLKLKKGHSCEFVSDFSESDNQKVLNFVKKLKDATGYNSLRHIEFPIYHPNREDIVNIRAAFELMKVAKEMNVEIVLKAPDRMECALWPYYEDLEAWSRNAPHLSYVEYLMDMQSRVSKLDALIVAENPIHWSLPPLQNFADLCRKDYSMIKDYAFLGWENVNTEYIPFDQILRLEK